MTLGQLATWLKTRDVTLRAVIKTMHVASKRRGAGFKYTMRWTAILSPNLLGPSVECRASGATPGQAIYGVMVVWDKMLLETIAGAPSFVPIWNPLWQTIDIVEAGENDWDQS